MNTTKFGALVMTATATCALAACTADKDDAAAPATSSAATSTASDPAVTAPELPTAADLNAVLAKAVDPNLPPEEKATAVEGGEQAPEIFDVMAASQAETGASFEIVDPVLPGYTPDSVLATAHLRIPDQEDQTAENVEFIYQDGMWKLSQSWACTLVTNTVAPEQVPPVCVAPAPAQDPAQAGEEVPPPPPAP